MKQIVAVLHTRKVVQYRYFVYNYFESLHRKRGKLQ